MLRTILVCLLAIAFHPLFSQGEKECRGNIDLDAFFEKIELPPDTATAKKPFTPPSGIYCPEGTKTRYRLRVSNDAFTVVSFTIMVETQEDDLAEVTNEGEYLARRSQMMIVMRKHGEPVYLSCIKVKTSGGTIRILKPITLNSVAL